MDGIVIGLALGALLHMVVLPAWVRARHRG